MKKIVRYIAMLLLPALFMCACKSDPSGKIFRYDIAGPVTNLDPQFTTDQTARMILGNLMEGLLLQLPDGEILLGAAESYTLSPDKLLYRFTLREDMRWSDGTQITAADFEFAFFRIFSARSPHAKKYLSIKNAADVLDRTLSPNLLGVRAVDARTLEIALEQPDPFFLEMLCDIAATPCNADLFTAARGRYGLEKKFVPSNGPFKLDGWDNTKRIQIRSNEHYASDSPTIAGGVNFHIGRDSAEQFLDGNTDIALLPYTQAEKLKKAHIPITPVQKTVWCIVFNQNHPVWGNPLLRQGLALTVDREALGQGLIEGFSVTSALVPDALRLNGRAYRQQAFADPPLPYNPQEGERLFEMGLSGFADQRLPLTTVVIPELVASALNLNALQQGWQSRLSAYLNFTIESPAQIQNRFASGDYQMLIMPFTPESPEVSALLEVFTSDATQNRFGYHNPVYDELIQQARDAQTVQDTMEKYLLAEKMILSDAVVIPLYFETTYLAFSKDVQDIQVSPFGERIIFKYASRNR